MYRVGIPIYFTAVIIMATCIGGCDSSKSTGGAQSNRDDLISLGVAYHAYHDRNGQGPDSADDLINMLTDPTKKQDFSNSTACKKLKSGEFVLNPRIRFREAKDLANTPILYERNVPAAGGIVVLGDATAKEMTPAEFKQLDNGDDARAEKN
jgi:hypothetical protein